MKKALISVYDKQGVVEFASELVALGYEVISTGGTYKQLKAAGLAVTYISDVTEFPEILDGRVKTLHPRIHGGILAKDEPDHIEQLSAIGGSLIDVVAVNLYPFEAVSQNPESSFADVIENIDIGGPTLIRAAAKNHERVTVLCHPSDYATVIERLQNDNLDANLRRELAAKAFAHTAYYDTLITTYLGRDEFPSKMTIALEKVSDLRYGENPHQKAAFYQEVPGVSGLSSAVQLNGKELSFNNIYDAEAAWQMASSYSEPCVAAVKHCNPCGLAVADNISDAYQKAYEADPISIYGGIVAANGVINEKSAREMSKIFLEVIIAPDFTTEALKILQKKSNLRLLKLDPMVNTRQEWKKVTGGFLVQDADAKVLNETELQVVTKREPTEAEMQDLYFAWKAVKYVKSNAIVFAKDQQLIGVGAGQMNRVQSVRLCATQAGEKAVGAVLASDAFFPFADNIEEAAAAGIKAIIQPGGSIRDQDSIDACNEHGIAMVFTGVRHFRH